MPHTQKCVLILGCRQIDLPKNRALQDLEILRIVSHLTSKLVTQELQSIKAIIGKIICVDQGSDMLRGVKDFQLSSPETCLINDTAHKIANILESALEKNKQWIKFRGDSFSTENAEFLGSWSACSKSSDKGYECRLIDRQQICWYCLIKGFRLLNWISMNSENI
jgi:hypothetical protein